VSYNGSGTFVVNSSGQPVVTGTVISSTAFNALTADLATGLSTAITKDGQTTTTARILFAQGVSSTLVTDATSATTGSIITAGGISAQKALWVGTTATIAGATTMAGITATSLALGGATLGTNALAVTGTTALSGLLTAAGGVSSTLVTDATSSTTGSIITAGGISCQKAAVVGTLLGVGIASSTWSTGNAAEFGSTGNAVWGAAGGGSGAPMFILQNSYYNGAYKYAATAPASYYQQNNGVHGWYTAPSGTAAATATFTNVMSLTQAGNLGIGTSSPAVRLDVATTGNTVLAVRSTSSGSPAYYIEAAGGGTPSIVYKSAQNLRFSTADDSAYTNYTERMRLDSSGNLGIGMTPSNRLDITQTTNGFAGAQITNSSAGASAYTGYQLNNGTITGGIFLSGTGNTDPNFVVISANSGGSVSIQPSGGSGITQFKTNGSESARIDSSGNLLVGTTSMGTIGSVSGFQITSSGAIYSASTGDSVFSRRSATGTIITFRYGTTDVGSISTNGTTTAYNTTSDARLKTNVSDAAPASALIDAIQVRQFDWKVDNSHQRYGMVAQELLEVAPEAVSVPTDPEEMMGVDYSKLVPMLIKEVQSLRTRLAALENK